MLPNFQKDLAQRVMRVWRMALLALPVMATVAYAQDSPPDPAKVIVVTDTDDLVVVPTGVEGSVNFSALINHDPIVNQECTLEGPTWSWTGSGGTLTSEGPSAALTYKFDSAGIYTVTASATATYKTTWRVGNEQVPGDDIVVTGDPKSYRIKAIPKVWSKGDDISGGELTGPQDQTQTPASPATVFVNVGTSLDCTLNSASDTDNWWADLNGDGIKQEEETGKEDDIIHYSWTATGGSFSDAHDPNPTWMSKQPGTYTLTCAIDDEPKAISPTDTGNRDDDGFTRSVAVTVLPYYSLSWNSGQTPVASGSKSTSAHQAIFTLTIKDGDGNGVPNYAAPAVEVLSGGRGGHDAVTAHIDPSSTTTDALGNVTETFTSGNRSEQTVIGILKKAGDKTSGAVQTLNINQVWSDLSVDNSWTFDPYFDYNAASPITFKAQFTRNGSEVDIDSHNIDFITTRITGAMLNEDGSLGLFDYNTPALLDGYLNGNSGAKRKDLVVWDPVTASSSTGSYTTNQTIKGDDTYAVDTVEFNASDKDSFDKDGDN